jgi:2-polyprenyl-6-hydroxyphenyl methylase/3-demethylubiquinone-9 3-methyltransferase
MTNRSISSGNAAAASNPAVPNVDPSELAKFATLAHRWWDPNAEFAPLHAINPLRLRWIEDLTGGLQGKRVVDIGCGGGILAEAMAASGAQVKGIDLADKPLKVAMLHALETGSCVDYECIASEDLAAREPSSCDVVTCMEMLEHVPAPERVVEACSQLAKPGAWVFFSTISRNPKSFLFAIVGAEYVLKLLPRGTHQYSRFIRPSELLRSARKFGLEAVQARGLLYNPLTGRYRLGDDTSVNYMLAFRKPLGLGSADPSGG